MMSDPTLLTAATAVFIIKEYCLAGTTTQLHNINHSDELAFLPPVSPSPPGQEATTLYTPETTQTPCLGVGIPKRCVRGCK
mmetsp:Transcript_114634/g.199367  ORF Transcript_114634/g.199367 Transcript_114634/m.199367 type:complete len:81 (+) Transcript_114634:198-440(+)